MRKVDEENTVPRHIELPRRKRIPPELIFVASPAYDFFLTLHIAFNPSLFAEVDLDHQWVQQARASCPPELLRTLTFFFGEEEGHGWCAVHLYGLLHRSPVPEDVPATIDWLRTLPVAEVLVPIMDRSGLGDDWRVVATNILQADPATTDSEDQRARVVAFTKRFPAAERDAVQRLVTQAEAERERLLATLHEWYQLVFATEAGRLRAALTREVERQRVRQATLKPPEVFASVIQGIAFEPPANVGRIVLAPCLMTMPIIFSYTIDDTLTYCYPIEEAARSAAEQEILTRREMVRLFDALADDTRLRILRHLVDRQMYLTELSDHLKLTKATTRHHMIRLRAAGLVTLHNRDHLSYYSLRREALDEPTRTLLRFLDQKSDG